MATNSPFVTTCLVSAFASGLRALRPGPGWPGPHGASSPDQGLTQSRCSAGIWGWGLRRPVRADSVLHELERPLPTPCTGSADLATRAPKGGGRGSGHTQQTPPRECHRSLPPELAAPGVTDPALKRLLFQTATAQGGIASKASESRVPPRAAAPPSQPLSTSHEWPPRRCPSSHLPPMVALRMVPAEGHMCHFQ